MGRRKRQSTTEDALELLFELTGFYWQIGAVASFMLLLLSFCTFTWIDEQYVKALSSPYLGQLAYSYGWVIYLLPLIILGLAMMFCMKSYDSYLRAHF